MTDHRHWRTRHARGVLLAQNLAAFDEQRLPILREKPDELLASGAHTVLALQSAHAEKICLVLADDPAHAQIVRRDGAVRVMTDDDETFFRAQDVERFRAE